MLYTVFDYVSGLWDLLKDLQTITIIRNAKEGDLGKAMNALQRVDAKVNSRYVSNDNDIESSLPKRNLRESKLMSRKWLNINMVGSRTRIDFSLFLQSSLTLNKFMALLSD